MCIVRVIHNRENPYVQLNKEALCNPNLSLDAVGLWARCMSRPDNWEFKIPELVEKCKEGKATIYRIVKELIREGYAMRLEHTERGADKKIVTNHTQYIFFEFPPSEEEKKNYLDEFKNSFRHPESRDAGKPAGTNIYKPSLVEVNKEATKERSACAPVPLPLSIPRKKVKEAKEVKADRVSVTASQHKSLVEQAKGDEQLVQSWYDRLSKWKIGKEIQGGNGDYRAIINWVIKAVEEDKKSPPKTTTKTSDGDLNDIQKKNWQLNQELVEELKLECPEKCGGLHFFYKFHVLKDKNNRDFDLSALINHADFCRQLDKKYDLRTYEVRIIDEKLQ